MKKTLIFILVSSIILLCACNKEIPTYDKDEILLQVCITSDSCLSGKYANTYTYELHTDSTLTTVISYYAFLDEKTKMTDYHDVYKVSTVKLNNKKFGEIKSFINAVKSSERIVFAGTGPTMEIMTDNTYDCLMQALSGTHPTNPYLSLPRILNKYSRIKLPKVIKSDWDI